MKDWILVGALVCALCATAPAQQKNILVIVADDMGVDRVAAYGEHPNPGNTPVIDNLAASGMLFRNAWSNPVCSTTRASMLTGRYSFRTGIGAAIHNGNKSELDVAELAIPELLPPPYRSAAVGKWHLSGLQTSGPDHPLLMGFEHHHGALFNIGAGAGPSYYEWKKSTDGTIGWTTKYATTDAVDDAITLIDDLGGPDGTDPWFVYLAFNAPHVPLHYPPGNLHSFNLPPTIDDPQLFVKAAIEAMDTEIGRLLASMDSQVLANTYVIFLGDNGTDGPATTPPFDPAHAKGTTYEGGLNVPLIVSGPGVEPGTVCRGLVNTSDLFATIADIVGVQAEPEDSVSLVPYFDEPDLPSIRPTVYAEIFTPDKTNLTTTRERAVRDMRYKLRRTQGTADTFFDLLLDPFEANDLLTAGELNPEQQQALSALDGTMNDLDPILSTTWLDVGFGMAGKTGVPRLSGTGSLEPGSPFSLRVINAAPLSPLFLVYAPTYVNYPFKGGKLVPTPGMMVTGTTNELGRFFLFGTWPPGVPPLTTTYYHAWIPDTGGPEGFAATNALTGTTQGPAATETQPGQ